MATPPKLRRLPKSPPKRPSIERRTYVAAVLTGLYAANGVSMLHAENHDYTLALVNMRRVADDQADEMLRRQA